MILNIQNICSSARPQPAPAGGAGVTRQLLSALCAAPSPGPPQCAARRPAPAQARLQRTTFPLNHGVCHAGVASIIIFILISVDTTAVIGHYQCRPITHNVPSSAAWQDGPDCGPAPCSENCVLSCKVWSVKCGVRRKHK